MEKYKGAIYIGRFQPFHEGHLATLRHAMDIAEKVLVIIGSAKSARDIKNPFTYEERKDMILSCFMCRGQTDQLVFEPQRDYFYDESQWRLEITERIKKHFKLTDSLALVGVYKDDSSYYLNQFPFLEFVPPERTDGKLQDATNVRIAMYTNPSGDVKAWADKEVNPGNWRNMVHVKVKDYIEKNFMETDEFKRLQKEYATIENYKKQWANSPYPPSFITSDVVLKSANNVLVVKRKLGMGKGLLALPGGFVRNIETMKQAAIRELREETGLKVSPEKLNGILTDSRVFDYPKRSLRGRTVTNAFFGVLPKEGEDLHEVSGGDDAAEAFWMPIFEVYERSDEFFEDHFHIIHYFLTKE